MKTVEVFPESGVCDVAVLGAGPAAIALAGALGNAGLRVTCVAPAPCARWRQRFGSWADELPHELVGAGFSRPLLVQADGSARALDRAYALIDTAALQAALRQRARDAIVLEGRAVAVDHGRFTSRVELEDGRGLEASLVVDASGAASSFVERVDEREPAFQSAFGLLVRARGLPYQPGEMAFMDVRDVAEEGAPPSFLYALPLGEGLLFAEETSLAARPAVAWSTLCARLQTRLERMGIEVEAVLDHERCLIPMGTAPPRIGQRLAAFGAAASLVHPATGYQLARSLALAPVVARAIAVGLARGGGPAAASAALEALWPANRRRSWELYTLGMEVLVRLDARELDGFLRAFFELRQWRDYLDGNLEPAALARAMLDLFSRAPWRLRRRIARAAASRGVPRLWCTLHAGGQA